MSKKRTTRTYEGLLDLADFVGDHLDNIREFLQLAADGNGEAQDAVLASISRAKIRLNQLKMNVFRLPASEPRP